MLRLADIEGGADQKSRLVAGAAGDDFRAQRVGAQKPVGAMLFGRADGNEDGLGAGQIGLDLRPGGKMKLHQASTISWSLSIAFFHKARSFSTAACIGQLVGLKRDLGLAGALGIEADLQPAGLPFAAPIFVLGAGAFLECPFGKPGLQAPPWLRRKVGPMAPP